MNKYEKSLAAFDELLNNTSATEFERDYLAAESNVGTTISEYLEKACYEIAQVLEVSEDTRSLKIETSYSSNQMHSSNRFQFDYSSFLIGDAMCPGNDSSQELAA